MRTASLALALALIALAFAAGDSTGSPQSEPVETAVDVRPFSLANGFVTGEVMIPPAAGPRPVVLQPLLDEQELLARGIAVVRFHLNWQRLESLGRAFPLQRGVAEPADPLTMVGKWLLASPRPGVIGRPYLRLIGVEAAFAVPSVLDHLEGLPEIDPDRIAIAGSSTRGFVALEALVHDRRPSVAVVRAACGDYHEFLKSSSLALAGDERWLEDGALVLDADYERQLSGREPVRFANVFPPRAVLLLNGGADRVAPASCARSTARALEREYARRGLSERFRFVLYENRGHALGPQALEEVRRWWELWLMSPP